MNEKTGTENIGPVVGINKKYYVEMTDHKDVMSAPDEITACKYFLLKLIHSEVPFKIGLIMLISEAGFDEDIKKYGTQEQRDVSSVCLTRSVFEKILDDPIEQDFRDYIVETIKQLNLAEKEIISK